MAYNLAYNLTIGKTYCLYNIFIFDNYNILTDNIVINC